MEAVEAVVEQAHTLVVVEAEVVVKAYRHQVEPGGAVAREWRSHSGQPGRTQSRVGGIPEEGGSTGP